MSFVKLRQPSDKVVIKADVYFLKRCIRTRLSGTRKVMARTTRAYMTALTVDTLKMADRVTNTTSGVTNTCAVAVVICKHGSFLDKD